MFLVVVQSGTKIEKFFLKILENFGPGPGWSKAVLDFSIFSVLVRSGPRFLEFFLANRLWSVDACSRVNLIALIKTGKNGLISCHYLETVFLSL